MLDSFLAARTERYPSAVCPLKAFIREFRGTVPAADRPAWSRTRIVADLVARGLRVASDGRVTQIYGLGLIAAPVAA